MATIEIDTERGWTDLELQVRDIKTHELLAIYDMFERNPTLFSSVANELLHRARTEQKLEHDGQIDEIGRRLGR